MLADTLARTGNETDMRTLLDLMMTLPATLVIAGKEIDARLLLDSMSMSAAMRDKVPHEKYEEAEFESEIPETLHCGESVLVVAVAVVAVVDVVVTVAVVAVFVVANGVVCGCCCCVVVCDC